MTSQRILIQGMTCTSCERIIHKKLSQIAGVTSVQVDYVGGWAEVTFDEKRIDVAVLEATIRLAGYDIKKTDRVVTPPKLSQIFLVIAGLVLLVMVSRSGLFNNFPIAESEMGYAMLFITGVLTSVHCIAMCGGINLSQCLPKSSAIQVQPPSPMAVLWPSIRYNSGRVVAYTVLGGIVGAIGAELSFGTNGRAYLTVGAGIFMVLMGMNLMGLLPWMRHITAGLSKLAPKTFKSNAPFVVGLANGLLPCGPLQAMQIYALGTGSALKGALAMLAFSLGTVPLMLGFGIFAARLGRQSSQRMLKAGAVLVVLLGVIMVNRGFVLTGSSGLASGLSTQKPALEVNVNEGTAPSTGPVEVTMVNGVQTIKAPIDVGTYPKLSLKKGVPAKINFYAEAGTLNGCNRTLVMPDFKVQVDLKTGDNWVSFTPTESGTFGYSCWMGMVTSSVEVKE